MKYRNKAILAILIISVFTSAKAQSSEQEHSITYIGGSVGMPVMVSFALETEIDGYIRIGFHAGSMLIANSLAARFIFGGTGSGLKFRYFAGAAAIYNNYREYADDTEGLSGHGWCGAGIDWNTGECRLAIETGLLIGGSDERGLGYTGLTPTWGISFLHGL